MCTGAKGNQAWGIAFSAEIEDGWKQLPSFDSLVGSGLLIRDTVLYASSIVSVDPLVAWGLAKTLSRTEEPAAGLHMEGQIELTGTPELSQLYEWTGTSSSIIIFINVSLITLILIICRPPPFAVLFVGARGQRHARERHQRPQLHHRRPLRSVPRRYSPTHASFSSLHSTRSASLTILSGEEYGYKVHRFVRMVPHLLKLRVAPLSPITYA